MEEVIGEILPPAPLTAAVRPPAYLSSTKVARYKLYGYFFCCFFVVLSEAMGQWLKYPVGTYKAGNPIPL
jgi:hypothetical protein